jgi:hypothetical protein
MLDLRLSGDGWITRTYAGGRLATEIRSQAEATGSDSCRVHVRFLVADAAPDKHAAIGGRYRALYEQLYNEDERMMIARAEAIRRGPGALKLRRAAGPAQWRVQSARARLLPPQGLPLDAIPSGRRDHLSLARLRGEHPQPANARRHSRPRR